MKWLVSAWAAVVMLVSSVLYADCQAEKAAAEPYAPPPPMATQVHPDIFSCGVPNCQDFNPLSVLIRGGARNISYRLLTMSGCQAGTVPGDLLEMSADLRAATNNAIGGPVVLVRNDDVFNFTIRINCGSEQIRICSAVNIFCLGRGFPQNPDVEISDILSTYQPVTRISILCHEVCGHALLTWNEQYCLVADVAPQCAGQPQFAPAPNAVDIMSTGPLSRHLLGTVETDRFQRTGLANAPAEPCGNPCWDGSRWQFADGWSFRPNAGCGEWYNPTGRLEWGVCDPSWGGRWNDATKRWMDASGRMYDPVANVWSRLP